MGEFDMKMNALASVGLLGFSSITGVVVVLTLQE